MRCAAAVTLKGSFQIARYCSSFIAKLQVLLCRAHKEDEGECEASECNLLCEDMLRAGFSRFVVDPGVRQAYYPDTARQLYTKKVPSRLD